ncbi:DUF4345 domain-containing protein [Thalassobaculum sp.]|uniref:DUF4345 domain-containing protein n=1 Tax=Thalassobaculum sp. TaxID=2022740 RepID=UPI0032ECACD7
MGRLPVLTERRALQAAVAVLALVPIGAGAAGVLLGPGFVAAGLPVPADLDSHFRYLSGIFLALGLAFWSTVPAIERRTGTFRLLGFLVVVGGLARLGSLLTVGVPHWPHLGGLALELLAVPALVVWQARVARRRWP